MQGKQEYREGKKRAACENEGKRRAAARKRVTEGKKGGEDIAGPDGNERVGGQKR